MTRARNAASLVIISACALLLLVALPVTAQEPYPPSPPPEEPDARVELTCEVDDDRVLTCEGSGYLPGSTVTIEVREAGRDGVVAEFTAQVGEDGTFVAEELLPCSVAGSSVVVRVTGRDSRDRPNTQTRRLEVPDDPDCPGSGVLGQGDERDGGDVLGVPVDRDDDGSLAFTGRNLLLLAAIALVLLALGAALVRHRRRQGDGSTGPSAA